MIVALQDLARPGASLQRRRADRVLQPSVRQPAPASVARAGGGARGLGRGGPGPCARRRGALAARADLKRRIAAEFEVDMHERTVGKYLAALGYRRLTARPRHPRSNAQAQEAFKNVWPAPSASLFSILPFQSAPTYPASEPCSPPRWSSARPGPHKTPGVSAPFFEPGFQVAVQLSGHLDPPLADIVGRATVSRGRSFSTQPPLRHRDRSRRRCAAPPRRSARASPPGRRRRR